MINKYAGNCSCGTRVEPGAGNAFKGNDGRWAVSCANCTAGEAAARELTGGEAMFGTVATRTPARTVPANANGSYTLLSGHAASPHQAAIFDHFRFGRGSRIVKAVAGSGKTTTMKNGVRYLPEWMSVQMLAFNVEAADQLKAAIDELTEADVAFRHYQNVRAGTFHSLCMRYLRKFLQLPDSAITVVDGGRKTKQLMFENMGSTPEGEETVRLYAPFVAQLVGLAKGEGIGTCLVTDPTDAPWFAIIDHHGLTTDSADASPEMGVEIAKRVMIWSEEAARKGRLDYDDQLYLVVKWNLNLFRNHVVIADECQDTNPVRRAILHLALRDGGRLYAVGDPCQSIYGFTGATNDAMDLIAREFNTRELPLTVSYRCARSIVERAQTWVPYIEPSDFAIEGEVLDDAPLYNAVEMLSGTDAILCRQTAPLVSVAYAMIARGRACRILGREIGDGLVNLIEQQRAQGIDRLVEKLEVWRDKEMAKFQAKGEEQRAEGVADRVNCVLVLIEALPNTKRDRTVPALVAKIQSMFSDDKAGEKQTVLTLCTVHKAKGKEWDRVAILKPELMPSRAARQEWQYEQEVNLMYVAATRAKETLIYCAQGDTSLEPPRPAPTPVEIAA